MIKVDEIQICDDCLVVCNGDPSMGDAESQARCAKAAEGLALNWPGFHVYSTCEGDCGFSWSSCDGCGNSDGDTRHSAVVLANEETEN